MQHICFIGAGNMATSLIGGLIQQGYSAHCITATDPNLEKLEQLQQQFSIRVTQDNQAAAVQADIIVLAVKPQVLANVAQGLAARLNPKQPLVISIAAGINIAHLQQWLGEAVAIVRCMPNTPALIGCGAAGMYANNKVTEQQKQQAESIMQSVGIALWLESEEQIDTVTALSGSGPAYFFLIIEALIDSAQVLGLTKEQAQLLAKQTALGAAKMAMEGDVVKLRQQVTSPGGTTEQAVKALESGGLRELLMQALKAAQQRSIELSK